MITLYCVIICLAIIGLLYIGATIAMILYIKWPAFKAYVDGWVESGKDWDSYDL